MMEIATMPELYKTIQNNYDVFVIAKIEFFLCNAITSDECRPVFCTTATEHLKKLWDQLPETIWWNLHAARCILQATSYAPILHTDLRWFILYKVRYVKSQDSTLNTEQ